MLSSNNLRKIGNYIDAGATNKINEEYIKNNYADTTYK